MSAAPSIDPAHGHDALMDRVYRHQRYVYDFTRKSYLLGRDRLIGELALRPGESLAEIGCGTGRNLIAMARAYPEARLFGLDASAAMLETAARQIRTAGLGHRIVLAQGLAEALTPSLFGQQKFENILFSYSLSMIPDWRGALAAAASALAERGRLHVVDFGDLAGLPAPAARLLRAWLGRFHVTPRQELLREIELGSRPAERLILLPGRYAFCYRQQM
jgi:S-adenosylmethionine-diacylgycerolhomoserine-N-methlytransferase